MRTDEVVRRISSGKHILHMEFREDGTERWFLDQHGLPPNQVAVVIKRLKLKPANDCLIPNVSQSWIMPKEDEDAA